MVDVAVVVVMAVVNARVVVVDIGVLSLRWCVVCEVVVVINVWGRLCFEIVSVWKASGGKMGGDVAAVTSCHIPVTRRNGYGNVTGNNLVTLTLPA